MTGVYKNVVKGVVALVFRCRPLAGEPHPTDESADAAWRPVDVALAAMSPAFAVRIEDSTGSTTRTRAHDGVDLL